MLLFSLFHIHHCQICLNYYFSKFTFPFACRIIRYSNITYISGTWIIIVKLAFICIFAFIAFNNATLIVFLVFIIKVPPLALLLLKVIPPTSNRLLTLIVPAAKTLSAKTILFTVVLPCKSRILPLPPLH
ncbi:hypothetical protein RrIowa_0754 [Rickettsia rickettsii str. Iowa]|uniref:Uncharacterized protein n=1 Tax=Rickettsia rickettsii (strain Iowa) TaxID=452659 RepID=B0BXN4_RICRO|nr:hypothetical protein RrIowa_0754 [Rickettsia rickettsii str. Iowa]